MEVPARLGGLGAIIAIVVVVLGVLIAIGVIPASPVVVGCCFIALAIARLV